ncbi:MAG: two component signal transduction system response regulator [Algoriphagus marincola HL-49]|uniref:Two component signal transduction system response regulator n=1 Tax=Algoriphagus marincola HL-49 TaxID=1305737 RepID=A0A0P7XQ81_9BACT|nr:MAG: two component signal transduction system response regulator [Algoriphagus marincola HL-49]
MIKNPDKVLIIDDDSGILFLHEIIVREAGLHPKPHKFSNAKEALELLKSEDETGNSALIFLDINMPIMNGWEFLDQLSSNIRNSDIKVIMVTSSLDNRDQERSKRFQMVIDFWEKPMDEARVKSLIKKLEN